MDICIVSPDLRWSLLSRGAWIEIMKLVILKYIYQCRSSHEERGLKYLDRVIMITMKSRSSHEERGLKSTIHGDSSRCHLSLLSRGAWIEMNMTYSPNYQISVAPLTRSVD